MCEAASLDVIGSAHSLPPSGNLTVLPIVKASNSPKPCHCTNDEIAYSLWTHQRVTRHRSLHQQRCKIFTSAAMYLVFCMCRPRY